MAALGWLLNLDFAAGTAPAAPFAGVGSATIVARGQRSPYRHNYGYKYIAPLYGWLLW